MALSGLGCRPTPGEEAHAAAAAPPFDPPAAQEFELPTGAQLDALPALLEAASSADVALDLEASLKAAEVIPTGSPLAPLRVFLEAEALRLRGQSDESRPRYRWLAEWGLSEPYGDEWGGCSLAIFGLWRWLEAIEGDPEPRTEEVEALLRADRVLRKQSRLTTAVFSFGFLDSLPQLQEDLARRVALLAARVGQLERAQGLFVDFLQVNTSAELDAAEAGLLASIVEQGWVAPDRIEALRADRLIYLRQYELAMEILTGLLDAGDAHDRARAGLELAKLKGRLFSTSREEISALLDTALLDAKDPELTQELLRTRAGTWGRPGSDRDLNRFIADLEELLERFPNGGRADDALYDLARHHLRLAQREPESRDRELARAFDYFSRLREFGHDNDWLNSAYFQPAMALYALGGTDNLERAIELFDELNERVPGGPLHRNSAFWKARALVDLGERAQARAAFEEVIGRQPLDYHAMRSRMHLALGSEASRRLWPDSKTRAALAKRYRSGAPYQALSGTSAYHRRLAGMLDSGLYRRAVEHRKELRRELPAERLQVVPLEELDRRTAIPALALLLMARQDALAAVDRASGARNLLEVLAVVGRGAADWPLVTSIAIGSYRAHEGDGSIQSDPRYLSSTYPRVFGQEFRVASARHHVPAELLYGLARRESLFDPEAISAASALGLFQFIPSVFDALDKRWSLLPATDGSSREEYLLDPERSIDLGARWLVDELLRRQNCVLLRELDRPCNAANRSDGSAVVVESTDWFADDLSAAQQRAMLLSLMEHSAGYTQVKAWLEAWRELDRENDFEYMVETAQALETRILMRGTLLDTSLALATGLLEEGAS